nr:hypothetical protein [Pyrinomonadaceae bacterium]
VAWALFDTLEYSKDDFLRRGAKKGTVRVTFESDTDGRQYTVHRDTGNNYYIHDTARNQRLAEKKVDVANWLRVLFGVEPGTDLKTLFRHAVGVPQGLFTADFLQKPGERKVAFDRLLKVEEYREGAQRLLDTVNLIKERIAEVKACIARHEGQLVRYDELVGRRDAAQVTIEELSELLEGLGREAEERARAVECLTAAAETVNRTGMTAERLAVESDAIRRRLENARTELAASEEAHARVVRTEADHRLHVEATSELQLLETERAERENLRREAEAIARRTVLAESELGRTEEGLESAARARVALVELEIDIERQNDLERERERLIDLRARALAAHERLARLDRELALLRAQHKETGERIRQAERASDASARLDEFESELILIDNELAAEIDATTNRTHYADQRRERAGEIKRLQEAIAAVEREIKEHDARTPDARREAELETRARALTEQAAHLRAEIKRDEKMRREVAGGLCPILSERCLNIGEDRTLDEYFTDQLVTNQAALVTVEGEHKELSLSLRDAREAAHHATRAELAHERLARERQQFDNNSAALIRLDEALTRLGPPRPGRLQELKNKRIGVDAALRQAREAALRFAELEPLRERLSEIEEEGKRRKEERAEASAAAGAAGALEAELAEVDRSLKNLNDPRGRAVSLRAEAGHEAALEAKAQTARAALDALHREGKMLDARLEQFHSLDERVRAAAQKRDESIEGYREHLAATAIAAQLPARRSEFVRAQADAETSEEAHRVAVAEHESAIALYDEAEHTNARNNLSVLRERIAATNAKLENERERVATFETEIATLEEVRQAREKDTAQEAHLRRLHEATDFVRDILKQAGPEVTQSYVAHISVEANGLFREITGEAGRTLRWSGDYEIYLEEAGYERPFANLSGGEQMVAALSVRLALLKQLSDIRLAFFDEPTVNMDAERRENLARAIGQVSHFDQLFVISHDDAFEETVDNVVVVSRRDERRSAEAAA